MPEEITIDKIRTALGDPEAPWYGSDVVSLVGDLIEDYADLKEVQQADYASAVRNCEEANKLTAENDKLNKRIKMLRTRIEQLEYQEICKDCSAKTELPTRQIGSRQIGCRAKDKIKELEAALEKIGLTNSPKKHWEIAEQALKGDK